MYWGERPRWARWVSVVWVIGFVEGFGSHLVDVSNGGWHAYDMVPMTSRTLFFALLLLDPLTAVLVALARPAAPLLGAAVMLADITANYRDNWGSILLDPLAYVGVVGIVPITFFGVFVVATAVPLRRAFRRPLRRA